MGAAASALRGPTEAQAERLAAAFRAPLHRGLLIVQAAKETIDLRTDALLKLQTARARCEQKRVKLEAALSGEALPPPAAKGWLERLQSVTATTSVPATVEDMQMSSDAAARVQCESQERYDVIKDRMAAELPRLHVQLEGDLNTAFAAAAESLKELAGAQAAAWEEVMPGCSQVPPLEPPALPKAPPAGTGVWGVMGAAGAGAGAGAGTAGKGVAGAAAVGAAGSGAGSDAGAGTGAGAAAGAGAGGVSMQMVPPSM